MKPPVKNIAIWLLLWLTVFACKKDNNSPGSGNDIPETVPPVQKGVTVAVNGNIGGYLEALPARYDSTTKNYPLLIFLHGAGETGNGASDLNNVAKNATPALIKNKKFPPAFISGNQQFSFIVLTPQFNGWPSPADVNDMINYGISHYRVDVSRIYVSGLSMGGGAAWEYAAAFGSTVAAVAPICGASGPSDAKAQKIVSANLPVWAFHNKDDSTVTYLNSTGYVDKLNNVGVNPPALLTLWLTGGHNAWTKATDPNYKEQGKNIYEWMLQYTRQ